MILSRSKGWIGVDLGTYSVKLAQVERHGNRVQLSEAIVIRRNEPWTGNDESEISPSPSSEEISAALSLGVRFSGRRAAVTVPMALCDVRGFQIPDGGEAERRAVIAGELASSFGDAEPPREFDFWQVDGSSDKQPSDENVLVVSMARDWGWRVARDLAESGLAGRVLDGPPLAFARAVELGSPNSSRSPVAAVDWGCGRATLCVVLNGRPLFVRCLRDAGFAAVLNSLCKSLSVTPDEAQKLLADHGLPNRKLNAGEELQRVIEEVTAEPLDVFIGELNRTITFLRQQRRTLAPGKLVLFGGGATIKNVSQYLFDKLDLPVEVWRLEHFGLRSEFHGHWPVELLGPAVALSSLAWAKT